MQVSLDNTKDYDKIIMYINSKNGIFQNDDFNFYINIDEPIKNIACIKLTNIQVISNTEYDHDDIFYIELNNYDRVVSYIKNADNDFNVIKYFDNVQYTGEVLALSKYSSSVSYNSASFDWSDPSVYLLNPPEPSLHRFDITLRDKDYKIINRSNIDSLKLSICLYYIKKNVLYK
jgi:hypothetical protein